MERQASDSTYFNRRASEEQAAARRANNPRARQSHIDLAERYSQAAENGSLDGLDGLDGFDRDGTPEASAIPLLQPEFRIIP